MKCPNCKSELSGGENFCGKCGQKVEATTKATPTVKDGGKKPWLGGVIGIVVFILAFVTFRYLTQVAIAPLPKLNSQTGSERADLIADTVKEIKSTTALPTQLDEVTVWNDITAQPDAIRYHYMLVGADTDSLSNSYLKSYLGASLCSNRDTKYILDQGISMEYSYAVQGSTLSYFVSFTKADCQ